MELLTLQQYVNKMVIVTCNMFVCVLQLQIMSHRNFNVLGVTSLQCTTDQIALNIGLEIWNSYEISITI